MCCPERWLPLVRPQAPVKSLQVKPGPRASAFLCFGNFESFKKCREHYNHLPKCLPYPLRGWKYSRTCMWQGAMAPLFPGYKKYRDKWSHTPHLWVVSAALPQLVWSPPRRGPRSVALSHPFRGGMGLRCRGRGACGASRVLADFL